MARKICLTAAAFKKLVKSSERSCHCSSKRGKKRRGGKRRRRALPPRGKHGQFRKRRRSR